MLTLLQIENIALIEKADIQFDARLNVLTGETGTGKSIVIDALGCVLGARTSRDLIRTGAEKASVSAQFWNPPLSARKWLENAGFESDDELIVSRELFADGRNVCKVNSKLMTVSQLKDLGIHLVEIHGQHEAQNLLSEDRHLGFLDSYANTDLSNYQAEYQLLQKMESDLRSMQVSESQRLAKISELEHNIAELDDASLSLGEEEELTRLKKMLTNEKTLTDALSQAHDSLYGGEQAPGALDLLDQATSAIQELSGFGEEYTTLYSRLRELFYDLDGMASDVGDLIRNQESTEMSIDDIESRLNLFHRLRLKYHMSIEQLIEESSAWQEELERYTNMQQSIEAMQQKIVKQQRATQTLAGKIHDVRIKGAKQLEKQIVIQLADLNMDKTVFRVKFEDKALSPTGSDTVAFLFSANPGEELKPLSKTASGGELSRLMLAFLNTILPQDSLTLIFDEVDAGISGRAAQMVAEKLHLVSENKQVLCVTHLQQIAAMGDTHLEISKETKGSRTYTSITRLDEENRTKELARMLGGTQITKTTLDHAKELLNLAKSFKLKELNSSKS
jgi:DNA repair protein RecN (Recombination protein N)